MAAPEGRRGSGRFGAYCKWGLQFREGEAGGTRQHIYDGGTQRVAGWMKTRGLGRVYISTHLDVV